MVAIIPSCKGFSGILTIEVVFGESTLNVVSHPNIKCSFIFIGSDVNKVPK